MGIVKRGGHCSKAIYLNLSELNINFLIKHSTVFQFSTKTTLNWGGGGGREGGKKTIKKKKKTYEITSGSNYFVENCRSVAGKLIEIKKPPENLFHKPPKNIKHQLTRPFAMASNNSLIRTAYGDSPESPGIGLTQEEACSRKTSIQIEERLAKFQLFGRRFFLTASCCLESPSSTIKRQKISVFFPLSLPLLAPFWQELSFQWGGGGEGGE